MFNNLRSNLEYTLHETITDKGGNYIHMDILITDLPRVTIANIYAPNKDEPEFFTNLWEKLNPDYNLHGNWNCVCNYTKGTYNNSRQNNPMAKNEIDRGINILELADVWRVLNPIAFKFTWWVNKPSKKARLNYFLISQSLLSLVLYCTINT